MKWIYYIFSISLIGIAALLGKWNVIAIIFIMSFITTAICQVLMLNNFKLMVKVLLLSLGVVYSSVIAIGGYYLANIINPVSGEMFDGLGRAIGSYFVGIANYILLFPLYVHTINFFKKTGVTSVFYVVCSVLYGVIAFGAGFYILIILN